MLQDLGWEFTPDVMVGVAGTVTTVCAVTLGLATYDSKIVHGHHLSHEEVMATLVRLGCIGLAERKSFPGLRAGARRCYFCRHRDPRANHGALPSERGRGERSGCAMGSALAHLGSTFDLLGLTTGDIRGKPGYRSNRLPMGRSRHGSLSRRLSYPLSILRAGALPQSSRAATTCAAVRAAIRKPLLEDCR